LLSIGPELSEHIVEALRSPDRIVLAGITSETQFERQFVEPVIREVILEYAPHLEIAVHGWKGRNVLLSAVDEETRTRFLGWKESKAWSVTYAWGRHTPDMAIRDKDTGATMVIEVKFGSVTSGGGLSTGEVQRMIGQCVMAKVHHDQVIAVFGYRGDLTRRDEVKLADWLKLQGVHVVLRSVPA
jgi:hypothetical protein